MKKILAAYFYAHLLLCALGGITTVGMLCLTDGWVFGAPFAPVWGLLLFPFSLAAYLLGRLLCRFLRRDPKSCWNAAMGFYILSLVLLAFLWLSLDTLSLWLNIWNFPLVPPFLGLDAFFVSLPFDGGALGSADIYADVLRPLLGIFLAAVEPLCLTLGLLSGKDTENKADPINTDAPAEAAERTE